MCNPNRPPSVNSFKVINTCRNLFQGEFSVHHLLHGALVTVVTCRITSKTSNTQYFKQVVARYPLITFQNFTPKLKFFSSVKFITANLYVFVCMCGLCMVNMWAIRLSLMICINNHHPIVDDATLHNWGLKLRFWEVAAKVPWHFRIYGSNVLESESSIIQSTHNLNPNPNPNSNHKPFHRIEVTRDFVHGVTKHHTVRTGLKNRHILSIETRLFLSHSQLMPVMH